MCKGKYSLSGALSKFLSQNSQNLTTISVTDVINENDGKKELRAQVPDKVFTAPEERIKMKSPQLNP